MSSQICAHKITPGFIVKKGLQIPGKFVDEFEGLKTLFKSARSVTDLWIQILVVHNKAVDTSLFAFNGIVTQFTNTIGALELALRIKEWFGPKHEAWKGDTRAEQVTKGVATTAKTGKNLLDTTRFIASFMGTLPVWAETAKTISYPVTNVFDMIYATFTAINSGLKIHATVKKVKKYEDKVKDWDSKFPNGNTVFTDDKVVDVTHNLANEKLFGIEVKISDWDNAFEEYQAKKKEILNDPTKAAELAKLNDSLFGTIEWKINKLTKDVLTEKFIDEMRILEKDPTAVSPYKGLIEAKTNNDDHYLNEIKNALSTYLISEDETVTDPFLKLVVQDCPDIAKFINKNNSLHLKCRKWELLEKYTQVASTDCSTKIKAARILDYVTDKTIEKRNEIKEQKKIRLKAIATIVFAVALFALAAACLFATAIAPLLVITVTPLLIPTLAVGVSVVSVGRYLLEEFITIKTKQELNKTKLPKFRNLAAAAA